MKLIIILVYWVSLIRIQHVNTVPTMATRVEGQSSRFGSFYAFIDHLENPFIPVHFNAIHTLKSQNG